ncbi:DoxX family protein [Streptomyces sp. NPDC059456]|uniref:DoxX family protein n=1 Tax=Streptomyces sp. NPDC059456 TaxID=3346838 RepID=UPI00367F0A3D
MSTTATVVTIVAAVMAGFSGASVFLRATYVVGPLADYGVPRSWWNLLGAAKTAGGIGLLAGFFVPVIGLLAAMGLMLYFTGAVIAVLRARAFGHAPFPLVYMAPVVAALLLGFPG